MITIITDEKQIKDLHNKFHKRLNDFLTENINCVVGYPGGSFEGTVQYSSKLDLWVSRHDVENKFWNGFGLGRPSEKKNNSLIGEINFPYDGLSGRVAGAFAVEDNGNILVLHRGKIRGGKVGIGKNYFTDNFRGEFITAMDNNKETEFCLVGELSSPHFPRQVVNFINEISRVKNIEEEKTATKFAGLSDFNYTAEHFGKTTVENDAATTINRTHGIVVNALAEELKNKGHQVGNNKNMDLFIHKKGLITALFEIKTSSETQSLCTAAGQLIIYSVPIKNEVPLIAVLPDKLNNETEKQLTAHGITPLYYQWNGDMPSFKGIDSLLEKL